MMHICFITNEYPKLGYPHGGIGSFVHTISHKLVNKGHKITVVGINAYTKEDEYIVESGIEIYRLKPKVIKGLTWYFNYKKINKKLNDIHNITPIDIIETSELGLAFINKKSDIKYVIRLHGGHHFFAEAEKRKVSYWKGFQEKKSFRKADAFIAVSEYVKSHTSNFLSYNNKPIKVIMSSINFNIFKPDPNIEIESNTILFAGTVCEKKGVSQLIKAMPIVLKDYPEIKLYIYGRDWYFKDGRSYINYLKTEVIPCLDLNKESICFMGAVPMNDLAAKYAGAEICVFPSLIETQGLVAPEAMAVEKLVIFSECGPGRETIQHRKTGLLCNPYDENDIAKKMMWALTNKKESKEIAARGRAFVLSNFNVEAILKENLNFYKSI